MRDLQEIAQDATEIRVKTGLNLAIDMVHKTASDAGWYRDPVTGAKIKRNFGEVIALMHSELSEALEADRKDLKDDKLPHRSGVEVEFADCIIREFDTGAANDLNLGAAIVEIDRLVREAGGVQRLRMAFSIWLMLATAKELGLDLAGAIIEKNRFNRERADHKLENRAAAGGKKY